MNATGLKLVLSAYAGVTDVKPRVFEGDWNDAVLRLSNHRVTKCSPCPGKSCQLKLTGSAFSFAELAAGATRAAKNVVRVHAYLGDIDHGDAEQIKASMVLLKTANVDCALSSTHSHRPQSPRVRLAIRLSRPVMASEWPALWSAVDDAFKLGADSKARDPGHLFFEPTAPEGVQPLVWVHQGQPLDIDSLLAASPRAPREAKPKRSGDEWFAMLESIGDGDRNVTLTSLAGALFRLSPALAPELSFSLLHAVNEARCKPPLPPEDVDTIAASIARRHAGREPRT